jgi:hypothetical protein
MTEQERVWQRFNELPADAQKQVADLINFMAGKGIPEEIIIEDREYDESNAESELASAY